MKINKDCRIYVPAFIAETSHSTLHVTTRITGNNLALYDDMFSKTLEVYFYKFLAGNKCLKSGFADIDIEDLFLCKEVQIVKNQAVKQVLKDISRFKKTIALLANNNTPLSIDLLCACNRILQPKNVKYGLRKEVVRIGDPKIVPYAFYSPPVKNMHDLLSDVILYLNKNNDDVLNKSLVSMMQLIFIHPFRDGNGRLVRALVIALLSKEIGMINTLIFLLYFKNINSGEYYMVQKYYREGNLKPLILFHQKAIEWTNKSASLFYELLTDYLQINNCDIENNNSFYGKIVVKSGKNKASNIFKNKIFQFKAKQGKEIIYVNTALLNVIHQFDYYLRFELRSYAHPPN